MANAHGTLLAPAPLGTRASLLKRVIWGMARFASRNHTVVLFVLFLVLVDLGFGTLAPLWEQYSPDDYTARVRGCSERQRDVVFTGGSPVSEGIDPTLFVGTAWGGDTLANAYALGLAGGTTTDVYYAVKRACPTAPRVLVYGITASDINDSRGEPHGARSLMSAADVAEVIKIRPDAGGWTARHYCWGRLGTASNIYRYRHGARMWLAFRTTELWPGSCPEAASEADELHTHAADLARGTGYAPCRGFRGRYDQAKAAGQQLPPFAFLDRYRTGSHLKYLDKLANWCTERGAALVLVDMPVTVDLENQYPTAFAEYYARLAEYERALGLKVIRGARAGAKLTDEHFADQIHLNPSGCVRFDRWLRARLEELTAAPQGAP